MIPPGKIIIRIEHTSSDLTYVIKHLGITLKPEIPFSICQLVPESNAKGHLNALFDLARISVNPLVMPVNYQEAIIF